MKPIKVMGRKITIKIEENKDLEKEKKIITSDKRKNRNFDFRILTIVILLTAISLFGKIIFFQTQYKIGDIAKKDIISNIYMTYKDDEKKEEIVRSIINTSPKIYKRDDLIESKIVERVEKYFNVIGSIPKNLTQEETTAFINESGVIIPSDELRKILILKKDARDELKGKIVAILKAMLGKGVRSEDTYYTKRLISSIDENITQIEKDLIIEFIEPNEFYDERATEENRKEKLESLDDIVIKINPGDIIIKKGQEIGKSDIKKLKATGLYSPYYNIQILSGYIIYFLVISILFYIIATRNVRGEILNNKFFYPTIIILTIAFILAKSIPIKEMYLFPFGAVILLIGIISNEKYAAIISGAALLFLFANNGFDYSFLMVNVSDLIIGMYYIKRIKNRNDIVSAGIVIGMMKVFMVFALNMIIKQNDIRVVIWNMVECMISGIFTSMVTVALLPYLENTFNILTNIKLIELGDFSNPLLKELMIKAPGTFHHSMLVATLSENAAEAVKANSLFTRVATYYHDIGKMKRPNFYVENQFSGINPHENLNPYMSALVISSHTKDGEEMARRYKIPKEIRDVMKEHQGTTLLAYFYNRAKKENPDVNEMDFRYEGPKPKTKESAIIMLADSVEAAVRSLAEKEKNPLIIEEMIRKIINAKIEDGQLSDAELTFKDIETVIQSFLKTFQGIYHVRIKYPDMKKK